MTAEYLRETAALMRERAEGARAGRWVATGPRVDAIWSDGPRYVTDCDSMGGVLNAQHIASWHPAVALAVADWLEAVAAWDDEGLGWANGVERTSWPYMWGEMQVDALAVARAYRGDS